MGYEGTILRTTDGGTSWISQTGVTENHLEGVSFTDSDNGTVVGQYGTILRTIDGGTTWISQSSGPTERLNAVSFIDSDNGTAVGYKGTILRTTNGGVSFVEEKEIEEIPTDYTLSQNYPNPFNPGTKIKYSIPQSSTVVIKVLDIIGNEIEILIADEKQAGTYELTWYVKNLPSGIYFYQLQAGNFVETKKMVLMK